MSKNSAAQSITTSLNVSFKTTITPEELIQIFNKEIDWHPWSNHLSVFFGELPAIMIQRFIDENGFSFEQLSKIYDALPQVWQGKLFRDMLEAATVSPVQEDNQQLEASRLCP